MNNTEVMETVVKEKQIGEVNTSTDIIAEVSK